MALLVPGTGLVHAGLSRTGDVIDADWPGGDGGLVHKDPT